MSIIYMVKVDSFLSAQFSHIHPNRQKKVQGVRYLETGNNQEKWAMT
jgi:hypothetical protein